MNKKLFEKLKQAYSPLGLGDAVLMAQADALVATGLVTDDNMDAIVSAQKSFLEGLQKSNDSRATEAAKKAEERVRKEIEEETRKKEEEAKKKAEEEAARKAAEKKAKEEEAARKAKEEEERKRLEELKNQEDVPEYFKKYLEQQEAKAKEEKKAYEATIKKLMDEHSKSNTDMTTLLKELQTKNNELTAGITAMKEESERVKAENAKKARAEFILNKAKELAIPQSRIDEGFVIADDATDGDIEAYLGKVAGNIKASRLPNEQHFQQIGDQPTKEETDAIAKMMIR